MSSKQTSRLARVNSLLLAAIIAVNAYLVTMPFIPKLFFWYDSRQGTTYHQLTQKLAAPLPATGKPANEPNQLVIPAMLYDQPIMEGKTMIALRYGPWRLPLGSSPDKGGNTVIAGHRFTYTNPRGTFYSLDKVKLGDTIGVIWQNKRYLYHVTTTEVVTADDIAIENQTDQPQLTLFTCTPLWAPTKRLVVVAALTRVEF